MWKKQGKQKKFDFDGMTIGTCEMLEIRGNEVKIEWKI